VSPASRDFSALVEQYAAFEAGTVDDDELLAAHLEAERLFTTPLVDTPECRRGTRHARPATQ
jgi:hypothetical protein